MPPSLRAEHLLATILSSTEDGLVSFALDGTIQTWSEGAARLYGYSSGEMIGEPLTRMLPLYEVPPFEEFLHKAHEGSFACCELAERLRKDGARIRVTVRRREVRDKSGKIAGVLEIARTKGWHAEGSAADAELRLLLEQLPGVLWTTDRNLANHLELGRGTWRRKNQARRTGGPNASRIPEMPGPACRARCAACSKRSTERHHISSTGIKIAILRYTWGRYAPHLEKLSVASAQEST